MTEDDWSIGVRRLGGEDDFTVKVSPEDELSVLHDLIAEKTGLRVAEQRLIYRGRLISGNQANQPRPTSPGLSKNGAKVKDVIGLGDGHTIHLVPKPLEANDSEESLGSSAPATEPSTSGSSSGDGSSGSSGSTSGLLAALLGLAGDSNNDSSNDPISQQLQRLRSARMARNRSRRAAYRLTESDLVVPDPGSTEGVRQGLMTMHSLIPELQTASDAAWTRQWYGGQWVDCLDTVNQWLEATVIDIVTPEEILPPQLRDTPRNRRRRHVQPTSDEVVTANDYDGRIRLLLETCDDYDAEGEWGGYRQRENNQGVQLLLIHYNGWPHRWDEWIRSDSERIRPFRTRTRHSTGSSTSLPSPQSPYSNAPTTIIQDLNEEVERGALLPELRRVVSVVNQSLANAIPDRGVAEIASEDLPWLKTDINGAVLGDETDDVVAAARESDISYSRRELENLAPLMDRLGRLLQDAAPHVLSYAATLPKNEAPEPERTPLGESNVVVPTEWELDAVATTIGAGSFTVSNNETNIVVQSDGLEEAPLDEDEVVLQNPDYSDFPGGLVNTARGESRNPSRSSTDEGASLLGTYLAAASLESLGGSRTSEDDAEEENGSGLQALSRAIRQRENNNNGGGATGGIDIHIHAIVSPGIGPGFGGMTMIGEPQVTPRGASPTRTPASDTPSSELPSPAVEDVPQGISTEDPDDQGIFAELYSDNVDALDLHATTEEFPDSPLPASIAEESACNSDVSGASEAVSEPLDRPGEGANSLFAPIPPVLSRPPPLPRSSPPPRPAQSFPAVRTILIEEERPRRRSVLSRVFRRAASSRRSHQRN